MLKLFRQTTAVILMLGMCGLFSPAMLMAEDLPVRGVDIEEPQTQISAELDLPSKQKSWIVRHKWWVIAGVTALVGSLALMGGSGSSGDGDTDSGSSEYPNDGETGQISGTW